MSCPAPLQNEEKKDDTVVNPESLSENGSNFKTKTTLGSLHYLISNCAGILEDAEDLVQQCYYDRKGLLEIPTFNSQKTLIQFINTTVPHWYGGIKDEPDFKRIVSFTKQFAKDGKILAALKFLLMLKKEYALLLTSGSTSFSELKGCYEKTARFQKELTAKLVFLGVETDALILWLGENQEAIKASENIVMPDLGDFEESLDCHSKSIQAFIEDLKFFCNDLKQRLIKNMLLLIDDAGRVLNLCPPYDPTAQNRGTLKRLNALLDCYIKKCASIVFDSEMFDNSMKFAMTGLQEERMHPLVERAMETFLNELSQDQIPQPLTFMRTLQSEIYNQKWVPEDKDQNQLSERKKHRYRCCPGIVDTP